MTIELGHTLIMLLLLMGLLSARPRLHVSVRAAIAAAVGLALVAPVKPVPINLEWLANMTIPLLLWQSAHRVVNARRLADSRDLALWVFMVAGIGGMLSFAGGPKGPGAFLFGVLAASMMWRATEKPDKQPSDLAQIGVLALAFLLAEIAPEFETPHRYFFGLIGGAATGALTGYVAVNAALEWTRGGWRPIWHVAQAYFAYALGLLLGVSGVAAAVFSIAVYIAYGAQRRLWPTGIVGPKPLDAAPVYIPAVVVLGFLGWQSSVPPTSQLLLEAVLGMAIAAVVVAIGRRIDSPSFTNRRSYAGIVLLVGLLLIAALLLWPRETLLYPGPLAIALLLASGVTFGARAALSPLLNLCRYLDEAEEVSPPADLLRGVPVREIMARDVVAVTVDTPALEAARLLSTLPVTCLPVVGPDGRLAGIVTIKDIFVKDERIRHTGLSFPAVFSEQVKLEELPEVYPEKAARHVVSDFMTRNVVSIRENHSVSYAVELMVRLGIKRLPVLGADRESRVVGLLTRRDLIRSFLQGKYGTVEPRFRS